MQTYTLDNIVREYLIEAGDNSEHRYPRMLQIAVAGLRELHMDVSGVSKVVKIDINQDNNTAELPKDYINHTFIGFCGPGGNLVPLGWNERMCPPRDYTDCGDIKSSQSSFDGTSDGVIHSEGGNYRNGELVGRIFGIGGGNNTLGYYRIDRELGLILLQDTDNRVSTLWMEYLGDPISDNYQHEVHPYDVEALKSWMGWKDIQRNKYISGGAKAQAQDDWYKAKSQARRRHQSFTIDEALQTIRKANKMSPKF